MPEQLRAGSARPAKQSVERKSANLWSNAPLPNLERLRCNEILPWSCHSNEAAPNLVTARSTKGLRISAPRFALPGELTQPSVALASFSGTKEPVRPDPTTQAAQQAVT